MSERDALAGVKVVDFSNFRTGAVASQILADFGAEVIHVETPGGSALRSEPAWPLWARGKRSIALDLKDADDLAVAKALCADADVVIETFRPGVADRLGIGYDALRAANPRLVYASISGFGSKGPLAGLQGYEAIVMAKFGWFWSVGDMIPGGGRPAFMTTAYASYPASIVALQGVLAALYERETSGIGQHVEATLAQAQTVYDTFNWFSRVMASKFEGGFKQAPRVQDGVPTGGLSFRLLIALTKDGRWMQFSQTVDKLFRAMMKMFELDWMFTDPKWAGIPDLDSHELRKEFWEILLSKVQSKTVAEWQALFDKDTNVWAEVFSHGNELLDHPQMAYNRMVADFRDPELGPLRMPGPIAHMSATPANVTRSTPKLGEHDAAIRAEAAASRPAATKPADGSGNDRAPLEGVTVVELGTYYAGPYAAALMADLGARVIKLEQLDGDPHRHMLPFPELAGIKVLQGKECVALDLASEKGREIAYEVIRDADVVLQSFRAGAAERLKLDAESLARINPNLIYLSAPGYGEGGPCGHRPAFAPTIGAAAGIASRNAETAIAEGPGLSLEQIKPAAIQLSAAVMGGGNADGLSAATAATAMLIALYARKRGAGGQHLLTTMLSSCAHALAEIMLDYAGKPDAPQPDSGLHGFSAVYRLYETSENWVFLAAPSDRDWARLVHALGEEGAVLAADSRFADGRGRTANDEALAAALSAIFKGGKAAEWEARMVRQGVACVACGPAPIEQHYMDEGGPGRAQGYVTHGHHPILEDVPRLTALVSFSRSRTCAGDAGLVGQDTDKVLRDYGYDEARIGELAGEGVILLA